MRYFAINRAAAAAKAAARAKSHCGVVGGVIHSVAGSFDMYTTVAWQVCGCVCGITQAEVDASHVSGGKQLTGSGGPLMQMSDWMDWSMLHPGGIDVQTSIPCEFCMQAINSLHSGGRATLITLTNANAQVLK